MCSWNLHFLKSLDAVECAEQLYVEQIRSSLLHRPEPSSGGTSSAHHTASLIYPVVGVVQQPKLISEIIARFSEESDRVNLASVRGDSSEADSAEGPAPNGPGGSMPRWEKYQGEFQKLLRRYGSIDGPSEVNDAELLAEASPSRPEERSKTRLSTSSSMMSINSNSSGSLEDLNLDNSSSF